MMTVSLDIGMGNKKRLSDISRQAEGYNKDSVKFFLGYMLSLNVALPVLSWLWTSGRQMGSPRRPNE